MRERLWSQRMLALYRSGRQAEALRVFQDLRTILVAELGIEPGHDVTWMEHAVLAQDPVLDFCGPARNRHRSWHHGFGVVLRHASYQVRVPTSQREGPLVGRASESATAARLVDVGAARVPGASSWSTVTLASGRRAWWPSWRAPSKRTARWCCGAAATRIPVAPFQPFAEALGRYFQSLSADRISRMPDWQLTELSRLVLRLREYAPVARGGGRRS